MGVSEKFTTAAMLLRTSWCTPASPPRNSAAPTRLMAMKENATGIPMKSRIIDPPSSSREAICHDILRPLDPSGRRHRILARPPFSQRQPVHAKAEFNREQYKCHRHRGEQPPFGEHQRFDG